MSGGIDTDMTVLRRGILSLLLVLGFALPALAQTSNDLMKELKETDRPAPIDWGFGPGVRPSQAKKTSPSTAQTSQPPTAGTTKPEGAK